MTIDALLPTLAQLAALAALLLVAWLFAAIGGTIAGRRRLAAADLLVGWAAIVLLMTLTGTLSNLPMRRVGVWAAVLGGLSLAAVLWRDRRALPPGAGRILVLLLPLLAVTASMQASQWDEFSHWLPNARYLVTVDGFPRLDRPPSDSVLPAYPYSLPLVIYLASRVASRFTEFAAAQFNLLLLAAFALLLAQLLRRPATTEDDGPGWRLAATGLLGATLLCPTFVPKLVLTSYADTATAATLAFAGVIGWRIAERPTGLRAGDLVQFALLLALLLLLKQGNAALAALLMAGLLLAVLRAPGAPARRLAALALATVPAIAGYLVWRQYVIHDIGGGEVAVQAAQAWRWAALPRTLLHMAGVAVQKIGFFATALVLTGCGIAALLRPATPFGRLALVFATLFVGYTGFLAFAYIAIFLPWEGDRIASYWRYNTHLGLFATAVAAYGLAALWERRLAARASWQRGARIAGTAAIVLALAAPVALAGKLRFDVNPVKLYLRAIAPQLRLLVPPEARLAVVDPRGDGFDAIFLDYLLGRGSQVAVSFNSFTAADAAAIAKGIEAVGARYVWVDTQSEATRALFADLPANASHLLERTPDGWRLLRSWPFSGYDDPTQFTK